MRGLSMTMGIFTSCLDQVGPLPVLLRRTTLTRGPDDIINVAAHRLSTGKHHRICPFLNFTHDTSPGTLEQAITSHPLVTEASVVGIPDALKGHLPFAFVATNSTIPPEKLFGEVNALVRSQVGPIASLGGMISGQGMIPKTRSGKTLRRVLRELLENGVHGDFDRAVNVPSTVEDAAVVEVARDKVKEYFAGKAGVHGAIEARAKL